MGQGGARPWQWHRIARCGSLAIRPFTYIRANNPIQSPLRNFYIRGAVATYFFTSPLIHIHFFLSFLRPFCYLLLQYFLFHFSTTFFSLLYLRQHILFSTSTLIVISRDIGDTRRSFGIFTRRLHSSYFFYISAATTLRQWAFSYHCLYEGHDYSILLTTSHLHSFFFFSPFTWDLSSYPKPLPWIPFFYNPSTNRNRPSLRTLEEGEIYDFIALAPSSRKFPSFWDILVIITWLLEYYLLLLCVFLLFFSHM